MFTHLSHIIKSEKNRTDGEHPWILLLKIDPPASLSDPAERKAWPSLRLCRNTDEIIFGTDAEGKPEHYLPFPFNIDMRTQSVKGEIPSLTLQVSNISREVQGIIEQVNGGVGAEVTILVVNTGYLEENFSDLEMNFEVMATDCDARWVRFTLGAPNPLRQRFPAYRYIGGFCNWLYESEECGYKTTLSGTLSIAAGSTIAAGTSTSFLTETKAGRTLFIAGEILRIRSVESDTAIRFETPHYKGVSGATAHHTAMVMSPVKSVGTLTGSLVIEPGSSQVTGINTLFATETSKGRKIFIEDGIYTIDTIINDTSMTLTSPHQTGTIGSIAFHALDTITGTVTVTAGSAELNGTDTLFTSETSAGRFLIVGTEVVHISEVLSDTRITLSEVHNAGASALQATHTLVPSVLKRPLRTLQGTCSATPGSKNITGAGTRFPAELSKGMYLLFAGKIVQVEWIFSDTLLTTTTPSATYLTNRTIQYQSQQETPQTTLVASPALSGTVSVTAGSTLITGEQTAFHLETTIGMNLYISGEVVQVTDILSANQLRISTPHPVTVISATASAVKGVLTGVASVSALSATVTGAGTRFTTEVKPKEPLIVGDEFHEVYRVNSDTQLTLSQPHKGGAANTPLILIHSNQCDRSLEACRKHRNSEHFGGFPGLASGGVKVV